MAKEARTLPDRDHIWQRGVWRAPWTDPHGHNQIVAIDSAGRLRGVFTLADGDGGVTVSECFRSLLDLVDPPDGEHRTDRARRLLRALR